MALDNADDTRLVEYIPEGSIEDIACEAAVAASATADAASVAAVLDDVDHGLL